MTNIGGGLQCKLKGKENPILFSNPQTYVLEETEWLISKKFRSYELLSLLKHLSHCSEILCCSLSLLSGKLDSASSWWPWKWVKLWKFVEKKQKSNVTAAVLFDIKSTAEIEIFMKKNQGSIY